MDGFVGVVRGGPAVLMADRWRMDLPAGRWQRLWWMGRSVVRCALGRLCPVVCRFVLTKIFEARDLCGNT